MAIFKYGEYKIDIDEEKTKKYFEEMEICDCQGNRNFQKYVDEMISDDEKAFFESLHIDLSKVDFCHGMLFRNKKYSCDLQAYIIGEFLSYPGTAYVTLDEVQELGIEILENRRSNVISVGHFNIHIHTPDEWETGSEDYENSIYVEFYVEDIPWLLNEKCEERERLDFFGFLPFPLKLMFNYIPSKIQTRKDIKMENKKLIEELKKLKENIGVDYEVLSDKEAKEYKKLWVNSILPKNSDKKTREKALKLCVNGKKYNTYLWHIFSFDIIESMDNPIEEFNKTKKNNCILVFEANKFFVVKLKNAKKLTEQDIIDLCNNVAGWCDFVITADDFSWTYSRTHEDGWCGPYFYRKDDDND